MRKRVATVAVLAACSSPVHNVPATGSGSAPVMTTTAPAVDAAGPSQEETLAAIQKAMNELDEAAQGCWASAAVERFDIEGELEARIDIVPGSAKIEMVRDTARNAKLSACLAQILAKYPWAPPLHGQTIQLPFKFRAPDGQNVIDRALVAWVGQSQISVATLLDENNSGNGAASMVELAISAGASTGLRSNDRAELWYFLGPATVKAGSTTKIVAAGDMMYVPKNGAREVVASSGDVHAVIAIVPGGREGSARAGALPAREVNVKTAFVGPTFLPASAAKSYPRGGGKVAMYAEPATIKDNALAASVLELPAGAAIPEHVHAKETEMLYVLGGAGTMKIGKIEIAVTGTSVVQVPPNTPHSFTATQPLRAVQIYTPAGPEQRFKQ